MEVVEVLLEEEKLVSLSLEAMEDEEVVMVDGVFEGAFRALGDETWSVNNCFGGIMLIFGLLEGLEVEALVEAMKVMVVDDK
ncbi:hypothetical protein Tco_1310901 [Tanacetum coccineum]